MPLNLARLKGGSAPRCIHHGEHGCPLSGGEWDRDWWEMCVALWRQQHVDEELLPTFEDWCVKQARHCHAESAKERDERIARQPAVDREIDGLLAELAARDVTRGA